MVDQQQLPICEICGSRDQSDPERIKKLVAIALRGAHLDHEALEWIERSLDNHSPNGLITMAKQYVQVELLKWP